MWKGIDIAVPAHYFPGDDPAQAPVVRWRSRRSASLQQLAQLLRLSDHPPTT